MAANLAEIEARLWDAADNLRANSGLASHEYSTPVLGIIFLRFADQKFAAIEQQLAGQSTGRRQITAADYQARGVLYLPPEARYDHLLHLPEGQNIGQHVNNAMRAIEDANPELRDVLPKTYTRIENDTLRRTRDLLLPKLIAGEVPVGDPERQTRAH